MANHIYEKNDVVNRLDVIKGKSLGEIDNKGIFVRFEDTKLQKGIAGTVIEQCVFDYEPDNKQEADLIIDGVKTELKTTGMLIVEKPKRHYVAKEPMSITAVGVYDIAEQEFYNSHFWEKLEHMLIVYYYYKSNHAVSPYEYKDFPVVDYEFHIFNDEDIQVLKNDWEQVRDLCVEVVERHPGKRTKEWKNTVKEDYIKVHGRLRPVLSYIDLAPKFPPRFRLKKPIVSTMISNHFGDDLEKLTGRYRSISDVDKRCRELTELYSGKTIGELAQLFHLSVVEKEGVNKNIAEQITVAMFGGKSKKINQIELFQKFGLIGKTVTMTASGGRTEDMKLFHIDFKEMCRESIIEDGQERVVSFEDSELYAYFADYSFLCIMFEEPEGEEVLVGNKLMRVKSNALSANRFIGFKRIVFPDEFINTFVKKLWMDTRNKILNNELRDVVQCKKNGEAIRIGNGEISSAPNFLKSKENVVFIRGSATNASSIYKTEVVNGIKMLPQYVWIKGAAIVEELKKDSDIFK